MTTSIETTVHQWLLVMRIRIEKDYVRERLMSHPDYPSALSITSFLDDLEIENGVAQIEVDKLSEMPAPFLAFVDQKDFVLVEDVQEVQRTVKDFEKRWHGVVVIAERPAVISPELKTAIDSSRNSRTKQTIAIGVVLLLLGVALVQLQLLSSILLVTSVIGLIVSSSIVMRELGIETMVSQHLCGKGENTGCDALFKSKASTLLFNIKLSDAGMSFFAGIALLSVMSSLATVDFQQAAQLVMAGFCFATLPFTLFSVYYQWRVAKQWCTSCLLIVAVLLVIATLQRVHQVEWTISTVVNAISALGIFIVPGAIWLLIRPLIDREKELIKSTAVSRQFYLSPQLLETHLKKQPNVDVSPWKEDFQIGNAEAPLQLVVVSSHFCEPCSETHEILKGLVTKRKHIGITIRFLFDGSEREGRKATVVRHMLQYALSNKNFLDDSLQVEEMIATWYKVMDIEKFRQLYPVTEFVDVEDLLDKQHVWAERAEIQYTPTILINGYRLDRPFSQTDLPALYNSLVEIFSSLDEECTLLN